MHRIEKLRRELADDPLGRGYSSMSDEQIVTDMTTLYTPTPRSVQVKSLTGDQVFQATNAGEFAALSGEQQLMWLSFCGRQSIDPFGAANVAFVQLLFPGGVTLTNLTSLRTKDVTRAEELGLVGIQVGTVQQARL